MKAILTAILVYSAGLIATTAEEEKPNPIAPTGLTLVVCDSEFNVLDTIVVPEGKVSFEYTFTVPKEMVEIRLFAIGEDRIFKYFRENLTQNYALKRTDALRGPKSRILEARVKDGILKGFQWTNGIKPLSITDELRDQIQKDIKENKRSSLVTTKGEQDGAEQPATAPESRSKGSEKPQPESEGRPS